MGYAYQAIVTFPAASGGTQTNITLVAIGSATVLKTAANGGAIQNTVTWIGQTVPADLIVTTDSAGTLLANWDIESYDPVNGTMVIHILVPSLTTGSAVVYYISLGNSGVSTYLGGSQGAAYNTNYKGIWHLANTTVKDSSSQVSDANSNNGTSITGKVDGGLGYLATSSQFTDLKNPTLYAYDNATFSVEFWLKTTSNSMSTLSVDGNTAGWAIFTSATGFVQILTKGNLGNCQLNIGSIVTNDGNWHQVVCVITNNDSVLASNTSSIYVDGVLDTGGTLVKTLVYLTPTLDLNFGRRNPTSPTYFTGSLDEIRILTGTDSALWIANLYSNQNSPPAFSSFVSLGLTLVVAEVLSLTDALGRAVTTKWADTITLVETLVRKISVKWAESLALLDSLGRKITIKLADTLTLLDTAKRTFVRLLQETFTLVDTLKRNIAIRLSEQLNLLDLLSEGFSVKFSDVLNLSDNLRRIALLLDAALTFFRRYLADVKSVQVPVFQIQDSPAAVTPDPSVTYFRQYLGRI